MTVNLTLAQLDERIAAIRENLRDIVEQAAGRSGAADEGHADDMIEQQEANLAKLMREREVLASA